VSEDLLAELWVEADSTIPSDDKTPSMGSRFLLDGFDFEQEDNEGVLDRARLPEVRGLSGLPDGLIQTAADEDAFSVTLGHDSFDLADEDGMGLEELMKEAALPNLDWLDPTQFQDPERLPENPVDKGIPELEEAWGRDLSTSGLGLVPNIDKEVADYQQSIQEGPKSDLPGAPEDSRNAHLVTSTLQKVARQAMRESHAGRPIEGILRRAALELGELAPRAYEVMKVIAKRHGLAGNVFVQSAAFPGLLQGKWDEFLKKHAKSAKYILAPKDSKVAQVDTYLGKRVVTKVPWKKALAHYGPRLEASGHKVASDLKPRESLRRAFRSQPQKAERAVLDGKPIDQRPADRVSTEEAFEELAQAPKDEPKKIAKTGDPKVAFVAKQLDRWHKAGLLSSEAVLNIKSRDLAPRAKLKLAAKVIATNRKLSKYHGSGVDILTPVVDVSVVEAFKELRAAGDTPERQQREFEQARRAKVAKVINRMATTGLLSKKDAARILALDKTADELLEVASVLARTPRETALPKSEEAREFQGPVLTRAAQQAKPAKDFSPEQLRVMAAAKESGIASGEFRTLLRVVRRAMSEGVAGKPLDEFLRVRFSPPLLKAASHLLHDLRDQHEGLAGHLYVDASAYATKKGIKGCDKGGLQHRGNPIKFVMAMERCGSCVHANANGRCTKYKKHLVSSVPVEDPKAYQTEMIRLANGTDADMTASLYDPTEYGLRNEPLEEVTIGDHGATQESLGEVLFGGFEL